jgi:hypothetical protein
VLTALLAVALLVTAAGTDSVTTDGRLRGRVVDEALDWPVSRAVVRLAGSSVERVATTGPDGAFTFPDVPAGAYLLIVRREAYDSATIEVLVPSGREIVVDVQIARRPSRLSPVVVLAPTTPDVAHDPPAVPDSLESDGARALRTLDLLSRTGNTLASALGTPAHQRPPEPGGGDGHTLFVWGTDDESGRVLLDGAVIGAPLHLGGLLPSVDPELIDDARVRTGGAPARFDGGTGYVLELSTRAPAPGSLRVWGESNLLTDRLGGEAPLGDRGSILVGARRVRTEMLPRLSGIVRGYSYGDILARASLPAGARGHVRATFFETEESLRIPRDQGSDEGAWRNRAGSIAWRSDSGATRTAVRLSMASAMTDLPLLSALGGHLRGDVDRAAIAADRRWEGARWHWGVGGEVEHARFGRETRVTRAGVPGNDSSVADDFGGTRCASGDACAFADNTAAALYGDLRYDASDRVRLDVGIRLATDLGRGVTPRPDALPRVALEALVAPRTSVRLAAGRYSRLGVVFSSEADGQTQPPAGVDALPQSLRVLVVRDHATQFELAATHQWGRAVLGLATYFHRREGESLGPHLDRAVGVDASLAFSGTWLTAAASYTRIARDYDAGVQLEPGVPGLEPASEARSAAEHLVSLSGEASVGRMKLALSGAYARGIPYTSIVLDRPDEMFGAPASMETVWRRESALPARSYVRLDATLSGTWCLGGRECQLRLSPYVRVINALDRRDALFYYQDGDVDRPRALAALPAILSVGIEWEAARSKR